MRKPQAVAVQLRVPAEMAAALDREVKRRRRKQMHETATRAAIVREAVTLLLPTLSQPPRRAIVAPAIIERN